jgi:hypothetical protein
MGSRRIGSRNGGVAAGSLMTRPRAGPGVSPGAACVSHSSLPGPKERHQGLESGELRLPGCRVIASRFAYHQCGWRPMAATCQSATSPWYVHGPTAQPGIRAMASCTAPRAGVMFVVVHRDRSLRL